MSKFTKRHFDELKNASTSHSSPLAVIAHIDLDAFYAQCEQVRLGLTKDQPVVCRQWNSLIAVSYAARKFGISRMQTVDEALKLCPKLIFPHVATFKKGETTWKHYENPDVDNHKVSLDPFRRESRKIFSIFKSYCDVIEKAGIDETFLDLGKAVRQQAVRLFPDQLGNLNDLTADDHLPLPPKEMPVDLKWYGQIFKGTGDNPDTDTDNPDSDKPHEPYQTTEITSPPSDWEDILLMLATAIVDEIRRDVFARLKYTCSAGISRTKILAKLASPRNKPNGQTVIPNSEIINFMCSCEFTDMWGLGGKFGEEVVHKLGIPEKNSIQYLLNIPLDTLKKKTDNIVGERLYNLIRGNESSEVITRINIKSMQSVKQFGKPLKTPDDCKAWIKVFAADIAGRLVELDEEGANDGVPLRPRTVAIQQGTHHPKSATRRKQAPFSKLFQAKTFEEVSSQLIQAGESLLSQLQSESGNSMYPCSSLSLSVTGIVPITDKGSRTIDTYFKKSEKVKAAELPTFERDESDEESLFVSENVKCDKCGQKIAMDDITEHTDWHFAKQLQEQVNSSPKVKPRPTRPHPHPQSPKRTKKQKVANNSNVLDFFQRAKK